jgi:hypothetical protein
LCTARREIYKYSKPSLITLDGETKSQLPNKILVINSDTEFSNHVKLEQGSQDLAVKLKVDYEKYTLLIGRIAVTGIEAQLVEHNISYDCTNKAYIGNVKIKNGGYTALGYFLYAAIIPKTIMANIDIKAVVVD